MDADSRKRLYNFFASYFNQDWYLDDDRWEGVVARFVLAERPEASQALLADLRFLLATVPDGELERVVLDESGSYFVPSEGMRQWIENVTAEFARLGVVSGRPQ